MIIKMNYNPIPMLTIDGKDETLEYIEVSVDKWDMLSYDVWHMAFKSSSGQDLVCIDNETHETVVNSVNNFLNTYHKQYLYWKCKYEGSPL